MNVKYRWDEWSLEDVRSFGGRSNWELIEEGESIGRESRGKDRS